MSQALFKGFACKNSLNPHNNALEVGTLIISIFKDGEIKVQRA